MKPGNETRLRGVRMEDWREFQIVHAANAILIERELKKPD